MTIYNNLSIDLYRTHYNNLYTTYYNKFESFRNQASHGEALDDVIPSRTMGLQAAHPWQVRETTSTYPVQPVSKACVPGSFDKICVTVTTYLWRFSWKAQRFCNVNATNKFGRVWQNVKNRMGLWEWFYTMPFSSAAHRLCDGMCSLRWVNPSTQYRTCPLAALLNSYGHSQPKNSASKATMPRCQHLGPRQRHIVKKFPGKTRKRTTQLSQCWKVQTEPGAVGNLGLKHQNLTVDVPCEQVPPSKFQDTVWYGTKRTTATVAGWRQDWLPEANQNTKERAGYWE